MILHVIRQVPFSIRELHFKANENSQPFFKRLLFYFWNFMVRQNSSVYHFNHFLQRCNKDCDKHVSEFQGNGRKSRENYLESTPNPTNDKASRLALLYFRKCILIVRYKMLVIYLQGVPTSFSENLKSARN